MSSTVEKKRSNFVIHFSSDEEDEVEEVEKHSQPEEMFSQYSESKLKRKNQNGNFLSHRMVPSMMNTKQQIPEYEQVINLTTRKLPFMRQTPKVGKWFDEQPEQLRKTVPARRVNSVKMLEFDQQFDQKPKQQPKPSFVFESDEEQIEFPNSQTKKPNKESIESQIDSDEEGSEKKPPQHFNFLSPDQQMAFLSQQLTKKILATSDTNVCKTFMRIPIPHNIQLEFQIHKYQEFMTTQYQLWLCFNGQMRILASSISSGLKLDRASFKLTLATSSKKSKNKNSNIFLGRLCSDFRRNQYTLYDHENIQQPKESDQILCTIYGLTDFTGNKTHWMFVPAVQNGQPKKIYNNSISSSLKKLYKLKEFKNQIQRFRRGNVPQEYIYHFEKQTKILKNTTRNTMLRNEQAKICIAFLKIQKNRFKVYAGPGLTPLQLLAFSTVHLE